MFEFLQASWGLEPAFTFFWPQVLGANIFLMSLLYILYWLCHRPHLLKPNKNKSLSATWSSNSECFKEMLTTSTPFSCSCAHKITFYAIAGVSSNFNQKPWKLFEHNSCAHVYIYGWMDVHTHALNTHQKQTSGPAFLMIQVSLCQHFESIEASLSGISNHCIFHPWGLLHILAWLAEIYWLTI